MWNERCTNTCIKSCVDDETPLFCDRFASMLRNFERELGCHCRLSSVSIETLEMLLNSVALQASPHTRLKVILAWVNHDSRNRHCFIGRLLSCIPGALLGSDELTSLRNHHLVRNNCTGIFVVHEMEKEHLPYHSTPEGIALGLQQSLNSCSECLCFRFVVGCGEFAVTVQTGSAFPHLKVTLECRRVAVSECMNLPFTVSADISMHLCYEGTYGMLQKMNTWGVVEDEDILLVESGMSSKWVRFINVDPHERAQAVCDGKDFTLYVQVKNLVVNKSHCSHGNMSSQTGFYGCDMSLDRPNEALERGTTTHCCWCTRNYPRPSQFARGQAEEHHRHIHVQGKTKMSHKYKSWQNYESCPQSNHQRKQHNSRIATGAGFPPQSRRRDNHDTSNSSKNRAALTPKTVRVRFSDQGDTNRECYRF